VDASTPRVPAPYALDVVVVLAFGSNSAISLLSSHDRNCSRSLRNSVSIDIYWRAFALSLRAYNRLSALWKTASPMVSKIGDI
jgi:hypothetical protein